MPVILERGEAQNLIRLEGAIDIGSAAELKTLLVSALDPQKKLCISLESATGLDVTAVQLLWAARREAKVLGVTLTLTRPVPEVISATLADAGFASL